MKAMFPCERAKKLTTYERKYGTVLETSSIFTSRKSTGLKLETSLMYTLRNVPIFSKTECIMYTLYIYLHYED